MIRLNGKEINIDHFSDGSQKLVNIEMPEIRRGAIINWKYESDEEAMTLYFLVNHLREHGYTDLRLKVAFFPHARLDRVTSNKEVFTLKWMCKFINDLNFEQVHILDPHSNVAIALLDRVHCGYPMRCLATLIESIGWDNVVLHFPDWGAYKRHDISFRDIPACYGYKTRNWETGKIESLKIENLNNIDLTTKVVIMVDDIISKGDTMCLNALKLKEIGAQQIIAFASHVENTILEQKDGFMKLLDDGTINRLYASDSIFTGEHPKIHVYKA